MQMSGTCQVEDDKWKLTVKSGWGRQEGVVGTVADHPCLLKGTGSLLAVKMQHQYWLGTQFSGKSLKSGFVDRTSPFKNFNNRLKILYWYCSDHNRHISSLASALGQLCEAQLVSESLSFWKQRKSLLQSRSTKAPEANELRFLSMFYVLG